MKIKKELFFWILSAVESLETNDPLILSNGPQYGGKHYQLNIENRDFEEVFSHILYLKEDGLADIRILSNFPRNRAVAIDRMTLKGHQFLEDEIASTDSPIRIFISYAHEDQDLLYQLESHLALLKRQGIVKLWTDQNIGAGNEWTKEIHQELQLADVILFLISSDFLASDFCYDVEMQRALERHHSGQARVIPIIVRSCEWRLAPFGKLQVLPRDGKAITAWEDRDSAWVNVIKGLGRVVEEFAAYRVAEESTNQVSSASSDNLPVEKFWVYEVFKTSGVPGVTFVEIEEFQKLALSIAQPGRGIVVEGPSGIGKTSAVRRAIEKLPAAVANRIGGALDFLSARVPDDAERIRHLSSWHSGTVVIDDAHRLDDSSFEAVANHLKHLADIGDKNRKLILIGIPQTGQSLVNLSFDLANRIDIYRLGRVSDDLVIEMVKLGERALNIRFDRSKSELAQAAGGSLNIAQTLCYDICVKNQILETKDETVDVACNVDHAISEVMAALALKFHNTIKIFAAQGEVDDKTCINILEHIAQSNDGYLNAQDMLALPITVRERVQAILTEDKITIIQKQCPQWKNHFFFDIRTRSLVIDDPQLGFYLRQVSIPLLIREVGKVELSVKEEEPAPLPSLQTNKLPVPKSQTQTIKIFLASSSELKEDRKEFESFIYRKTKETVKEGVFLELVIWEDFLNAMSKTRSQDEYNKAIANCDVFVSLFHTKVGQYTNEEFLIALETFKDSDQPLIYTYFKDEPINMSRITPEIITLIDFKKKLSDMGHFYQNYADSNDLKYQFGEQLVKLLPKLTAE